MKKIFTTKNVAGMAVFSALSFVIYLLEIPIMSWSPANFLELDLSNVIVMLAGFMYGPIPAIIISLVKESIHVAVGSSGGVGELANFVLTTSYILIPSIVYMYRKGIKTVIVCLLSACVVQTGLSILVNRYVNFPLATVGAPFVITKGSEDMFSLLWVYVLIFNAIKSVVISAVTLLLYKKVSHLFKKINLQSTNEEKIEEKVKTSCSEEETFNIAKEYAKSLKKGDVVLLFGDLGAGKTAFTKGLASHFDIQGVVSPTYAYLNVYNDFIYHYDCYRLSSGEDAERLGLTDYFNKDNICIIEWSENIKDALPQNCKSVKIEKIDENTRKIYL